MKKLIPILLAVLLLAGCSGRTPSAAASNNSPQTKQEAPPEITEDEAIKIALEHAGLNTGAVKSTSVELDPGDGKYEVEFFAKGIEYDYEINAYTGQIIKAEKDRS